MSLRKGYKIDEDYMREIRKLQKKVRENKNDTDSIAGLSQMYYYARRPTLSIRYANKALKLCSSCGRAHQWKGRTLLEHKQYKNAIKSFKSYVLSDPASIEARLELAYAYRCTGQKDAELRTIQKAAEIGSDNVLWCYKIGEAFKNYVTYYSEVKKFKQHNISETEKVVLFGIAIKWFKKVLALKHTFTDAWDDIGDINCELHKYQSAINAYKKAVSVAENKERFLRKVGKVYEILGDSKKATVFYRLAINIDPYKMAYRRDIARCYVRIGDYKKAKKEIEASMKLQCRDDAEVAGLLKYIVMDMNRRRPDGNIVYLKQFITDYFSWADQLRATIEKFELRFGLVPHICCASKKTFAKIDMAMNFSTAYDVGEPKFNEISSFVWSGGTLKMAIKNGLEEDEIMLVYDDKAEFVSKHRIKKN